MGRFSKVTDARQTKGGVYFREGDYIAEIIKVSVIETRNKGPMFCIEVEIRKVLSGGSDANPVGSRPSSSILFSNDSIWGNINGFVSGVLACDESKVTEAIVEEIVSDDNPLGRSDKRKVGELVMINATKKAKKNAKDDDEDGFYVNLTWSKYTGTL